MKTKERINLPTISPGTQRFIEIYRYGNPTAGKKVYIQAGLHADEAPGFLVAHHLKKLLNISELHCEIILVPIANPIGLSQWKDDILHGRFHFSSSINFNRQHLELTENVEERIAKLLSHDTGENVSLIRKHFKKAIEETTTEDDAEFLKKQLLILAHDADIVLDLHCDNEALLHLYLGTPLWPDASDLAAYLGAEVTLLARNSGDNPFDEACSKIWWDLAAAFPGFPIPTACLSATVELRGAADTDPEIAQKDALNIIRFLQYRGFIGGLPPHVPPLKNDATPLTGVDYISATAAGIVVYLKKLGEQVREGEVVAEIVDPFSENTSEERHPVRSRTDGILFTRNTDRFAYPGRILAKIAGSSPLRHESGNLLTQ